MNELNPRTVVAAPSGKTAIPLDAVILTVRTVEFALVIISGMIASSVLMPPTVESGPVYSRIVFVAAVAFAVLAETVGSYDIEAQFSLRQAWQRVATAWVTTTLFLVTLGFLLKASDQVSREWAFGWFMTGGALLLSSRLAMTIWVRRLKRQGIFNQRVAIFGAGPQGARLANYILTTDKLTITLVGFYDDRLDGRVPTSHHGIPVHGNLTALMAAIRGGGIDQVIVALPWSAEARLQAVVGRLALTPVRIRLAPDLASFVFARRPVVLLGDMPVMTLFERPISGVDAWVKAAEDRVLAVLSLAVLGLPMLLIALAIRLDSPGPVFFRQAREGFNNRPFRVYKFRTMYHNRAQDTEIVQASRRDSRVTRVGALLRRTSLDELPQLMNVLGGDMSVVGPRPHAASTRAGGRLFSDVLSSYAARHKVKPGITGWAQVCGWRGQTDTEEKLIKRFEHDLYYIENWSIWFDFYVLCRTVVAVILPRNAF
ncbi:undecaprenyl-phosphate glucose phosphotransferase [Polymorphobacter sp. PAMC 29334]|uniref:undecaprenyl-phosphate glucose phosphotransferase n=1 Tax=Polymorphobacter sp. PAMC 29334 TaxID=2862331 RepID=UPI001C748D44|nr:undecaprenyl-phosphate glucose phosphotransferase [Polymorphobacter sp. PAMC 29334]QYE34158.1 undecaprenyl-phosphate glucose phosphotransferase [Polymorphobacter sp. PAMC 29334]